MSELSATAADISAIIEEVRSNTLGKEPVLIGGIPHLVVPQHYKVMDFESLNTNPMRTEKLVELHTLEHFINYYNRFASDESTIYCDIESGSFKAVFDHHSAEKPAWCGHKAIYKAPRTVEWSEWKGTSGNKMTQSDFASFIEDHIDDIVEPEGARMLEIVSTLQAKNQVNFRQGVRLDNGEIQLTYEENIEGAAGRKGQLSIPDTFKIGIKPFAQGVHYKVGARFRYRIKEGNLIMWYDLIRPHKTVESAIDDIFAEIVKKMKTGHIFKGEF